MLTVKNHAAFLRHNAPAGNCLRHVWNELVLPMLLLGSLGGITWAIRGTDGWGGIDGTLVPGLTWAVLWVYLCHRQGVDARGVALWLGLGLALGGELGYGQYVSWIRGIFSVENGTIPISPQVGAVWFVICGIGWGAPGGILLGWALNTQVSTARWAVRVFFVLALLVLIFNIPLPGLGAGAVTWLSRLLAAYWPGLLFPMADLGLYTGDVSRHAARTLYTNTQNAAVVAWWLCALAMAALHRDRNTILAGVIIGGGFGIGFFVSALWCLGYTVAPAWIDWWKVWELHSGFNLGMLYMALLYLVMRRLPLSPPPGPSRTPLQHLSPVARETLITLFMGCAGFVLVFSAGVEYFFLTGLVVALFYPAALFIVVWRGCVRGGAGLADELRRRVSMIYAVFLLLFILVHGGVSRMGVFLELYDAQAVDQYAWPPGRIALFLPMAAVLFLVSLYYLKNAVAHTPVSAMPDARLPERLTDLFMFIGFIGAVSIWPEKIGVVYAVFLFLALFAFTRINRRLNERDAMHT